MKDCKAKQNAANCHARASNREPPGTGGTRSDNSKSIGVVERRHLETSQIHKPQRRRLHLSGPIRERFRLAVLLGRCPRTVIQRGVLAWGRWRQRGALADMR